MVEGMSIVVNVMLSLINVMRPPLPCAHGGEVTLGLFALGMSLVS